MRQRLPAGPWRGAIHIQGRELPFQMEVSSSAGDAPRVEFINGEERVPVRDVRIDGEHVSLLLPEFDTRIDGRFDGAKLEGMLSKVTTGGAGKVQRMPVVIVPGERHRFFAEPQAPGVDISGRWAVRFTAPDGSSHPAVGEFRQDGAEVRGTFRTPTSDHRYLAGEIRDGRLHLSAWDGYHVFLYEAEIDGDRMHGEFRSGASWRETWTAQRDSAAKLPDMDRQTRLRDGCERIEFNLPDHEGKPLSLADARFAGKVVVVQLAGSWCPNSVDEARFLARWYERNRDRGVEVVALMFENHPTFERNAEQLRHWRQAWNISYPALLAGSSDKQAASRVLPQLDAVRAFPTTLSIGRDGRVARIRTGFDGPATGEAYKEQIARFNATIDALLAS